MTEAETSVARIFRLGEWVLGDWVRLKDVVLEIIARSGGKRELGLNLTNQYFHNGVLELALLSPDSSILTVFSKKGCEHREVWAPHVVAEGVRVHVTPPEAGQYLVAGFAKLTSSTTPATAANQQLPAAGGSGPVGAEESKQDQSAAVAKPPKPKHRKWRKRKRDRPNRTPAEKVVKSLWPDGVPPPSELPNKRLCDEVRLKLTMPTSDSSILRAAGRKDKANKT
jgi:hypothetical protein